jgi:hypothetical protein
VLSAKFRVYSGVRHGGISTYIKFHHELAIVLIKAGRIFGFTDMQPWYSRLICKEPRLIFSELRGFLK